MKLTQKGIKYVVYLFSFTLLFASCNSSQPQEKAESDPPPNVLFILVDDLGYHDLGVTGSTYYETPNVDRLAETSFRFVNGYSASRVCSPSRASIMTGKFTARHGITDWIGAKEGAKWREHGRHDKLLPAVYNHILPHKDTTIAEAFKSAGYKTFYAGKWHLGEEGSYPEDHGFDINKGGWDKGSPMGGYFSPWNNPSLPNTTPGENLSLRLADETSSFIRENKDQPFLAFLSFYAAHGPIQTTQEKWKKFRDKAVAGEVPENGFEMERVLPIRTVQDNPIYAGLVNTMDEAVGRVLSTLEELNLSENTIIVFTSDNGGVASGDAFATSNLPLRGGKGYQWEGGTRVPYFIYVPGSEGKDIDYQATGADFYPTLLDLAGQKLRSGQHTDGISLKSVIQGENVEQRPIYWHYPHYGNQGGNPSSVVRMGDWKLIYYYESDEVELYDLVSDPAEKSNIAAEYPEKATELKENLLRWLQDRNANTPQQDPEFNADSLKIRQEWIRNTQWQNLERQRKNFLKEDFKPNEDWWNSEN